MGLPRTILVASLGFIHRKACLLNNNNWILNKGVPPPRPGSPGRGQGSEGGWERGVSGLGGPSSPGPGLFARATPRGLATTRPRGRRRCSHPKFSPKAYARAALCPPGPGESLKERPYSEKSRRPAPPRPRRPPPSSGPSYECL